MKTELDKLWFDGDKIFIRTKAGETLWQSLLWYHRLLHASGEQRSRYYTSFSGIHWPEVDEDMSYESFYYKDMPAVRQAGKELAAVLC